MLFVARFVATVIGRRDESVNPQLQANVEFTWNSAKTFYWSCANVSCCCYIQEAKKKQGILHGTFHPFCPNTQRRSSR